MYNTVNQKITIFIGERETSVLKLGRKTVKQAYSNQKTFLKKVNVNSFNFSIKRKKLAGWIKNKT